MPLNLRPEQVPIEAGHFIAGFTDGEGSFYVSVRKRADYSTGWKFSLNFNISQNDEKVLLYCQKYLGCGTVRQTRPGKYVLEVSDLQHLQTYIIPFFERFQFRSIKKRQELRVFKLMVADLLSNGTITTFSRAERFLELRTLLGQYREERSTHTTELILASFICQEDR